MEVSKALTQTGSLKSQQEEAINRSRILEEALDNSRVLFVKGQLSYIDVLTVQRGLQTQLEEAAIACRGLQSEAERYRPLGGGWG